VVPAGQDHLRVTPNQILAPVGTEVVLKAGICGADGYLRTDRRVEWLLSRDGSGQFVDLGFRDEHDVFRWHDDIPRKIDNWYAIGATSYNTEVLQRGNLDPSDDVVVQDGEAWISVTSATEGTSHVTAYAPDIDAWQFRQAIATIYWVDAQWCFPPSAMAAPEQPHILTTTVVRRTDRVPLAGWLVRYEAASGGASLGYEGGNVVEVPTDAAGRASAEVSPTGVGSGTTTILMTLLRPASVGSDPSPKIEVSRGTATITWGGGGTAVPSTLTPTSPGTAPAGSTAEPTPAVPPGTPYARESSPGSQPAASTPSTGEPLLDVTIQRVGPEQVEVNQFVRFDVTVTNRGSAPARGILVNAQFDPGLSHPSANPGESEVKYNGMRDLPTGQSETVPLTFKVLAAGNQCHRVTVTCEGGARAFNQGCVIGQQATQSAVPVLSVDKIGPTRSFVGEQANFKIVIRNTGTVPVTNIQVVDKYDAAFRPAGTSMAEHQRSPDGSILWRISGLVAGEQREISVACDCVAPSGSACNNLIVTADGGINQADQVCVEILPQIPPTGAGATLPSTPPSGTLQPYIVINRNPARAGESAVVMVSVVNSSQQPQTQVRLRVDIPAEMSPNSSQITPLGEYVVIGQEVRFNPLDFMPGQRREFVIPVNVNRPNQVQIRAQLEGGTLGQPIVVTSNVITIQSSTL
jgi:uncharacterized repeat protein (TIGR01451 family)